MHKPYISRNPYELSFPIYPKKARPFKEITKLHELYFPIHLSAKPVYSKNCSKTIFRSRNDNEHQSIGQNRHPDILWGDVDSTTKNAVKINSDFLYFVGFFPFDDEDGSWVPKKIFRRTEKKYRSIILQRFLCNKDRFPSLFNKTWFTYTY